MIDLYGHLGSSERKKMTVKFYSENLDGSSLRTLMHRWEGIINKHNKLIQLWTNVNTTNESLSLVEGWGGICWSAYIQSVLQEGLCSKQLILSVYRPGSFVGDSWWPTQPYHRCVAKSLARPGRKQANVYVRMAWISFGTLPCRKILMTARVSMLLKSRASLTCFLACFIPGRAKELSAPGYTRS